MSATLSPAGSPAAVLAAWRNRGFELVVSPSMLAELRLTLARPRIVSRSGWTEAERDSFLALLSEHSILVEPHETITASRDPDDDRVIEAAVAGKVDYIVTGDQDLLVLGAFDEIPIITATRFATLLMQRGALS